MRENVLYLSVLFCLLACLFAVPWMEPRVLYMLDKHSTTELHSQPLGLIFQRDFFPY
jgi:hypothetical protein